jgi:hypothetical protein
MPSWRDVGIKQDAELRLETGAGVSPAPLAGQITDPEAMSPCPPLTRRDYLTYLLGVQR